MLHKIKTIYVKELVETLRDRRTLFAMIVIPVLLYPAMMYFMVQMQQYELAELQAERYVVAVRTEDAKALMDGILAAVQPESAPAAASAPAAGVPLPTGGLEVIVADPRPEEVGETIHVLLDFGDNTPADYLSAGSDMPQKLAAIITYRKTMVRSAAAAAALQDVFAQYGRHLINNTLARVQTTLDRADAGIDINAALNPIDIKEETLDTKEQVGGHLLSRIVPFILILMTATGAVYPAIDLTAGERERGTLETLLVSPVQSVEMTTGKFLVVTTIAVFTSLLNVASIAGTVWFGGIFEALAQGEIGTIPLHAIPIILFCLVPYAVLTAALMLAVCSFARTFKEAQNYVTPLLILTMIPAAIGTIQTVRLEGAMLVAPIANVTLFVRDLLQGNWTWSTAGVVLGSTSLYAAAAVALATKLFGQEAVLFADAAPLKTLLVRRHFQERATPPAAMALTVVALLFPIWFFVQINLHKFAGGDYAKFFTLSGGLQLLIFAGLPIVICAYAKINIVNTLRLRLPSLRFLLVGLLLGASTWLLAIKLFQQKSVGPVPSQELVKLQEQLAAGFAALGLPMTLLLLAIIPAVTEELMFRGFLQSGIAPTMRRWFTIVVVGIVFGAFHFSSDRFAPTAAMGAVLAYVCWQSGSIWPGVIAHAMHNGFLMSMFHLAARGMDSETKLFGVISIGADGESVSISTLAVVVAAVVFIAALALAAWPDRKSFQYQLASRTADASLA